MDWVIKSKDKKIIEQFSNKFKISPFQASLIANRGIKTIKDADKYLNGKIKNLYFPYLLKDIKKSIEMIDFAIKNKKKITIYGDYDVDGITATAVAVRALKKVGAKVDYYIPNRLNEGYGLNKEAISKIKEKGTELIITVDNGITSVDEVKYAKELGLQIIITDHHNCPEMLPEADAIINPKQKDDRYPNKDLCGCALIWRVMETFYKYTYRDINFIYNLLPLVALSTVADVVDLLDENRILVKEGLKIINSNKHSLIGLSELIKSLNIEEVLSRDIGFKIAPCINADGRLDNAQKAIELFLTNDSKKAKMLAENLKKINEKRKELTLKYFNEAEEYLKINNLYDNKVLVLFLEKIPEGIIGLVAGKIKEKYQVPTFVFTEGKDYYKASGRGVQGHPLDLYTAIQKTKDFWVKGGGHKMACGISMKKNKKLLENFSQKLNEIADEMLQNKKFVPTLYVDGKINNLTEKICQEVKILEPTGEANAEALFVTDNLDIEKTKIVGDGTHISFDFGKNQKGIAFGKAFLYKELNSPSKIKVAYNPNIDIYTSESFSGLISKRTIKMYIKDIKNN